MKHDITIKQFRDLLNKYPDDAKITFITYHDAWGAGVDVSWEQDPATDYTTDLPGTNEVWIRLD
jgi:hypothetical protein